MASSSHNNKTNKTLIDVEHIHQHIGHCKISALLAASENDLWQDTAAMLSSEKFYDTCKIANYIAHNINKHPYKKPGAPGAMIYMDIIPPMTKTGLTASSTFLSYLILVDR